MDMKFDLQRIDHLLDVTIDCVFKARLAIVSLGMVEAGTPDNIKQIKLLELCRFIEGAKEDCELALKMAEKCTVNSDEIKD